MREIKQIDIDKEIQSILSENNLLGLSLSIENENGDLIYDKGFGFQNFEQKKKANSNTYYRIASISKSITATCLMILYEQGKFKLTDDISNLLGYTVRNPNFPNAPITVQNILSHTSSIRDGTTYDPFLMYSYNTTDPDKMPNLKDLLTQQGSFYSNSSFGSQAQGYFYYSNLNYGICGTLVEKISGQRLDIFAKNNILTKLNITGSYNVADIEDWQNIAVLYRGNTSGSWVPQLDNFTSKPSQRNLTGYVPGSNGLIFGPQGGLHLRMHELLQLMKMFAYEGTVNGVQILSKDSVRKITSPYWIYNGHNGATDGLVRAYGYGIHITTNIVNSDIVFQKIVMKGHNGGAYGLISNMYYDPISKRGFTFAINGALYGYNSSNSSSFLYQEQRIQQVVYKYLYQ